MNKTIEEISKLNVVNLKELCKEYAWSEYNSKLNKQELINILSGKIGYINLDDRAKYIFGDLIKKDYTSNRDMNTVSKEWYMYKGFSSGFVDSYIDKTKNALKFDSIIFKTKNYNYAIVIINKNEGYLPVFKQDTFQLVTGGKHGHLFEIKYDGDVGFSLNSGKGILFINAIVNEYYFDRDSEGWQNLSEIYSHDFAEVSNFFNTKENFEFVKEFPRCYPCTHEGLMLNKKNIK